MAFKLDFAKLRRPRSAEEIEAEYQKERADARTADAAKRAAFEGKTLTLKVSETSAPFTMHGDRNIQMWGTDQQGRRAKARMFVPACYDRDQAETIVSQITEGETFTFHGYWKPYPGKEGQKTTFTFQVQRIDGIALAA